MRVSTQLLITAALQLALQFPGTSCDRGGLPVPAKALHPIYGFRRPLRVCFAGGADFPGQCNGAPDPSFEEPEYPEGAVPQGGWCRAEGEDFCGYDVDVWRTMATAIGLQEGRDYVQVCMGEHGFDALLQDLQGGEDGPGACDVSGTAVTVTVDREAANISFSRPTYRGALAIVVSGQARRRDIWAFLEPLKAKVWFVLLLTVLLVPVVVFFLEMLFSDKTEYTRPDGTLDLVHGLKEATWHSVSHVLAINVFKVQSFPARICAAAYAFMILIISSTYTANLAAFLTVDRIDSSISSTADLYGKVVATYPTYVDRLAVNHRLDAVARDGWGHLAMLKKLRSGEYMAVIGDNNILVPEVFRDESCTIIALPIEIEPFDLSMAFRQGVRTPALQHAMDHQLLEMAEAGVLKKFEENHKAVDTAPPCRFAEGEYEDTNQVHFTDLLGLWYVYGGALLVASMISVVQAHVSPTSHERLQHMRSGVSFPTPAVRPCKSRLCPAPSDVTDRDEPSAVDAVATGHAWSKRIDESSGDEAR